MRQGALSQGSNPFAFRPPLWFMEGMAEYLTTGEIDPLTAMWLRDGSLSGYLTTIDELSRVGDIRVYRFGQALWYYIGTKYGDEKIGEIMQKAPLIGIREAFQVSLNVDLDELSDDWLEAVRLTYLPQVGQFEHAEEVGHRLTDHVHEDANINLAPALSPDGSQLAFVSDRDYFNDIYIADAESGDDVDKLLKESARRRTRAFVSCAWACRSLPTENISLFEQGGGTGRDIHHACPGRGHRRVPALRNGRVETPSGLPTADASSSQGSRVGSAICGSSTATARASSV